MKPKKRRYFCEQCKYPDTEPGEPTRPSRIVSFSTRSSLLRHMCDRFDHYSPLYIDPTDNQGCVKVISKIRGRGRPRKIKKGGSGGSNRPRGGGGDLETHLKHYIQQ